MRTREEIEADAKTAPPTTNRLVLEVLLDIRQMVDVATRPVVVHDDKTIDRIAALHATREL